jgi:hypothetical protein
LELTLAQLEALEERRMIAVRHQRFNAALVASAIINVHRMADAPAISPFDFLAGYERDPEQEEKEKLRASVKRTIAFAFAQMFGKTLEQVQAEKIKMIDRMRDNGIEDPEGLIREVYPEL